MANIRLNGKVALEVQKKINELAKANNTTQGVIVETAIYLLVNELTKKQLNVLYGEYLQRGLVL